MQYFEKDRAREPRCLFCSEVYWVIDLTCLFRDSICALREVAERCPRSSSCFGNLISWDPWAAIAQLPLNSAPEHNLDTVTSVCLSSSPHRLQGLQILQPLGWAAFFPGKRHKLCFRFCFAQQLFWTVICREEEGGNTLHVWGRRPAATSLCPTVSCWESIGRCS